MKRFLSQSKCHSLVETETRKLLEYGMRSIVDLKRKKKIESTAQTWSFGEKEHSVYSKREKRLLATLTGFLKERTSHSLRVSSPPLTATRSGH